MSASCVASSSLRASSTARIAARVTLRRIAASAAEQTGRDAGKVLETLVSSQLKAAYADDLAMLPGAVEFELGLHQRDVEREKLQRATAEVLGVLGSA